MTYSFRFKNGFQDIQQEEWKTDCKRYKSDTKVTEASERLPNTDPEAAKKGTTIRVLWIPETANTYCWIQGEVTKTSVSEAKSEKGTIKTNEVTIENLILVECFGDEYRGELPPKIKIKLNPKQTWAMGPEATLSTGEENEAIQIDIDSIPRVIPWNNDDLADETEVKGAEGGVPVLQKKDNSVKQNFLENLLDSEDESSDDEAVKIVIEEKEARTLREKYSREDMSQKNSDCLLYTSPSPRDLSTSRMPSSA